MCGIILQISKNELAVDPKLLSLNQRRGPDARSSFIQQFPLCHLEMHGFTLSLRGPKVPQPLVKRNGVLLFNGQIYDGINVELQENDVAILSSLLSNALSHLEILEIISKIQGEFSLIYLDVFIFFKGRRSLNNYISHETFLVVEVCFGSMILAHL